MVIPTLTIAGTIAISKPVVPTPILSNQTKPITKPTTLSTPTTNQTNTSKNTAVVPIVTKTTTTSFPSIILKDSTTIVIITEKKIGTSTLRVATTSPSVTESTTTEVGVNKQPKVTLTANQESKSLTVTYNDKVTLEWTPESVDSCTNPYIAKEPNYEKPLTALNAGEFILEHATTTQTFFINCKQGTWVFVKDSVTLNVEKEAVPTVTLATDGQENSIDIGYGSSTVLTWSSTNTSTSSCSLQIFTASSTGYIKDEEELISQEGQINIDGVVSSKQYLISCKNTSGVATSSVSIRVMPVKKPIEDTLIQQNESHGCIDIKNDIRFGSTDKETNNEVSLLQSFLKSNKVYNHKASRIVGKRTLYAIKSFQKKESLESTGFVGPSTRARIKKITCKTTQ